MAKGKSKGVVSLRETVKDSEIVRLGEVRSAPNYVFSDNEYGIAGGYKDYSLVKKRLACRTGSTEDGANCDRVIEYEVWEDIPCYDSTLEGIFESYAKILNLTEFKTKKMRAEINELVEISQRTNNMISEALKGIDTYLTQEQSEVCKLADTKQKLLSDIAELKGYKNEIAKLLNESIKMHNEIKEARVIIVDRDKSKKHKAKQED